MGGAQGRLGPYLLEDVLGRGGMGVVYIGLHERTGRVVAVKAPVLTDENALELRRRFVTEAEVLTSLEHPGILPIYEVGEDEGTPYYAMKLAEGSLAEIIDTLPGDSRRAAGILAAVAEAVHFAHQRGVLHRDLKPQNILLDDAGQPLVADFGLARLMERDTELTLGEGVLGTPDYVAPEVAGIGPRGAVIASDIFSLGAILYHGLTGRPPFHGDTVLETIARISRGQMSAVRALNPRIAEDLELICHKCLRTDPAERYLTAAALAADLHAWLENRPLQVRPPTWDERAWRVVRRNPIISALSALSVVAVIGGTVATWVTHERLLIAERKRADAAENLANERLVVQCKVEAESLIRANRAGNRSRALELLRQAWAVRPDPTIRSLAIQALSLADMEETSASRTPKDRHGVQPVTEATSATSGRRVYTEPGDARSLRIDDRDGANLLSARLMHEVVAVSWNPAGDRVVVATADKHLYLWNSGSPNIERRMSSRDSTTFAMMWHPTQELVACRTQDGLVRIWDVASGDDLVSGFPFPVEVPLEWSATGSQLESEGQGKTVLLPKVLRIYRPESAESRAEDLGSVNISPEGRWASVVSEKGARVWDLVSGRNTALVAKRPDEWLGARWIEGGLLAGGWSSPLRIIPLSSLAGSIAPEVGREIPLDNGCTLAEVNEAGSWAAMLQTSEDRFLLKSLVGGEIVSLAHDDPYWIALDAKGERAVTSSFRGADIKVWDLPSGKVSREIPLRVASRVDLSPQGNRILATAGREVVEIDPETGEVLRRFSAGEEVRQAVYSPDGRWIALVTERGVLLHKEESGEKVGALVLPSNRPGEQLEAMTFSRDGRMAAVQLANGSLAVWDLSELESELAQLGMGW